MLATQFLDQSGLAHKSISLAAPVHTAKDVQTACGCTLDQVLKALLFIADDVAVLAVVPGDKKVDKDKLRILAKTATIRMATPEEVLAKTGYRVGTVSPFNVASCKIIIDANILNLSSVIVGSGDTLVLIEVTPDVLLASTRAQVDAITS